MLGDEADVALIAVGGYGRMELCPHSDLDLVLLHRGRSDVRAVADRIWYPIWDAGKRLDHSVRTVKDAIGVAAYDMKAALGLTDARLVAGDADLAADLTKRISDLWRKRAGKFLPTLAEQIDERHAKFGPVAFLLEPDVKEGHGGIRDIHALRAAMRALPVIPPFGDDVAAAYGVLLGARVALHNRTGRAVDRLGLEDQDAVAADLGIGDADELMSAVAGAARTIAWLSDDGWARIRSSLAGPRRRTGGGDRDLGPGVVMRDGEVVVTAVADLEGDPALPLRAGALAALSGAPLSRKTLKRFEADAVAPGQPWPPEVRDALVSLLGAGRAAIGVLEALDQHGVLVRLLPEWEAVRNKPQRNAYHRFTVDRHLCEAAANAAELVRRVDRPDLLLVGTLLHDIGKGFPGDHTEVGMAVVERVGARMGFVSTDVETLVAMVEHHLLLPDVATRRDLDDPATIRTVAHAVGNRTTLDLLHALTEADSLATGPSAWSDWKAGLVNELVARTRARLEGAPLPEPAVPTDHHRELMAAGEVVVEIEPRAITVVAPDRPGLLSRVAGALALLGLDVRSAAVGSENGMAVEVLDVVPRHGAEPSPVRVAEEVRAAIDGRGAIERRIDERTRDYDWSARATAAHTSAPVVLFDDEASDRATVVEVRARDALGLLYRVTSALAGCGVDIITAKVSTIGHEVVDAFYVTEVGGAKVIDRERQDEIAAAVLGALGGA